MPLSWKETRPGRWERPQSCLEKINLINRNVDKAMDRDQWAKTAVLKVEFDPAIGDPVSALKTAWKQVRYNYPEVAAFPYNGIYMYRIGNPEQVSLWVSATFSVADDASVDDLLGHIPRNEQMMCYWLPKTSEILIRSPHYRLDARGAIFCLNHLIEALANPNPILIFGGCAKNLSPSIDNALDIPFTYNSKIEKAATQRLARLQPHHPPLNMTPTIKKSLPGCTKRRFIKLSRAETRTIVAGSSAQSLDLNTTLHAALVDAVARITSPQEARSFMASFHCDLRFLIKKQVSTKVAPTSCTSVMTTEVEVSPKTNYRSYYAQLAPIYATGYGPYLESTACYMEKLQETYYSTGKDTGSGETNAQPRFGALGSIDHQIRKQSGGGLVTVKDFWLGAETLTKRKMVHTWIWEGQMVFSCCYNENYWEDSMVEEFLLLIKDTLLREIGCFA